MYIHIDPSFFFFFLILADHFELDAQISAADTPGQVEGHGDRLGRRKVPVFRVPRNRIHGRHSLSKSTGKYKNLIFIFIIIYYTYTNVCSRARARCTHTIPVLTRARVSAVRACVRTNSSRAHR